MTVPSMQNGLGLIDLYRSELRANPYPLYDALRANDPVYWDESMRAWLLTSYDDAQFALSDRRFGHQRSVMPPYATAQEQEMLKQTAELVENFLTAKDPPEHTRLRSLAHSAFEPLMVKQLHSFIEKVANNLLDRVEPRGEMDAVRDYAFPLTATIISHILGVPAVDQDRFTHWSTSVIRFVEAMIHDHQLMVETVQVVSEVKEYFHGLITERRICPQADLLTAFLNTEDQSRSMSEAEIIANATFLLIAGHETTKNLIGNGLIALFAQPDELQRLQSNPELVPSAIEELLRFDAPFQFFSRTALEDTPIRAKIIRKGQRVIPIMAAANRDPSRFAKPNSLDLSRKDNHHLSFGFGIHFCLGAYLARLETQIAFGTLLRRMPSLHLAQDAATIEYLPHVIIRGPKALSVRFAD